MGRKGVGVKGSPSLKFATHFRQWWNLTQLQLTQRISKYHVTHPVSSAGISFFHWGHQIMFYQEIQKKIAFKCKIFNSFDFLSLLGYFHKHDYKIVKNKRVLKQRLWRHNFSPWRHQQTILQMRSYD